jgi:hypothetical protein
MTRGEAWQGSARLGEARQGKRLDWTPARQDLVRTLWQLGYPTRTIAERLDVPVTRNAVVGLIHRHGWGRPMDIKPPADAKLKPRPKSKFKPPPPGGLKIEQLAAHHCRWPTGDRAPYRFCGHVKTEHSSYCHTHAELALSARPHR